MNTLKLKPTTNQTKKGFTIIEVVLVLAIAGLIFLIVFIALPALQRNQRDTQRKNDLATFASALQNYAANNRGRYPSTSGSTGGLVTSSNAPEVFQFATQYLDWPGHRQAREDKGFVDPSTSEGYAVFFAYPTESNVAAASPDRMNYSTNYRCPEPASTLKYTANAISIWQKLEGGGINCIDVR